MIIVSFGKRGEVGTDESRAATPADFAMRMLQG